MLKKQTLKDISWIDLESPTTEEMEGVAQEYNLPKHVTEELLTPTLKPRVEIFSNFIYLILHFPAMPHLHGTQDNHEVDFIIGQNFMITVHYDALDPRREFAGMFQANTLADMEIKNGVALFSAMLHRLYSTVAEELEYIADELLEVEDKIFQGEEKHMVARLSRISLDLLKIRQATGTHNRTLEYFKDSINSVFGPNMEQYGRTTIGEYQRINHLLKGNLDVLMELRETNNSLVFTKQGEVMKTLAIMAFVTLPLSLIASIFGMNTENTPIVGYEYDFWVIIAIMAMSTACFFTFFKYKRWL